MMSVWPIQSLENITSVFFYNLLATHQMYLVYSGACCVFDPPMIFAICHVRVC